ncbi:hypothetical protein BHE74_00023158 [Ensete ventricosum]|nr:hypothetical protein BHE74_00023158 [Ensete ventricosum]
MGDAALRGRCPRWRQPWPRALPTLAGVAPASASQARGRPRLLAAAPCGLAAPARGFWPWQAAPLQGALVVAGLAVGGRPCMGASRGWPPLLLVVLATNAEIVYPYIPDPDGEDEEGQTFSSLAVSTQWISVARLLQSDLATLAQREGGE